MTARDDSKPISRIARRSLGVSAEPITIGQRTGMKVVGVQPDSPAQKAGIEPGDVIVAANGVPVTGAEAIGAILHKSGTTVSLTVRDTRTGKDARVDVKLGGEEPGSVSLNTPRKPPLASDGSAFDATGPPQLPQGTSPRDTYFHNATKSFRANATIPTFRIRALPSANRR